MTSRTYLRAVVPIGVFYSASLVCSNLVYLYLNVAFIQMLKAGGPVAVLVISYVWGVSRPSSENVMNVVGIAVGVALASAGEIRFSWVGFLFQAGGVVFEAMRLVMIQVLLSGDDMKMDPLVSLYYYAPVCAAMNFFVALFTEFPSFQVEHLFSAGVSMLLLNALVAFMLNVASVFLVCPGSYPSTFPLFYPSHCLASRANPTSDRQDLKPRPHPRWHPKGHRPRLLLRSLPRRGHHPAPGRRVRRRAIRARVLLPRLGADEGPCVVYGRVGLGEPRRLEVFAVGAQGGFGRVGGVYCPDVCGAARGRGGGG